MEKDMNKLDLQKKAVDIRKGIISSVHSAKAGHPGGSLSAADIFTYLYFEELHVDPKNPRMRTEIVLYYPKDIQHRVTIQPLLREDFFRLRIF